MSTNLVLCATYRHVINYELRIHNMNFFKVLYTLSLSFVACCKSSPNDIHKAVSKPKVAQVASAIITQNSKHLKSGTELEITVQAEPISDTASATVKVNGAPIPVTSNGIVSTAMYVIKVRGSSGEYTIPVTVTHYNHDKEIKLDNFTVSYFIDD